MKKFLCSISLLILNQISYAADFSNVKPKGWYVENLFPRQEWLGVALKNNAEKNEKFYKVNIKTFETLELNEDSFKKDFQHSDSGNTEKIKYTLNNCRSVDEEYLSYDSTCESATMTVNGKKYNITEDKFYKWETFIEPVLWDTNLIFKAYYPRSKSGDTGRWSGPKIYGITIVDLKNLKRRKALGGAFITSMLLDKENSYLWVGSQYGIYAFDKELKEIISCAFPNDMKRIDVKEFSFVCGSADYLFNNKFDQSRLLIEKYKALKQGRKPPEDSGKAIDEAAKSLMKKK